MKYIKKYRTAALLISMFILSLHVNAVFEGRSEQLKEYTEIRQEVEVQGFSSQKATGSGFTDPNPSEATGFDAPISDAPWIMLILGLGYGLYAFARKTKHQR